MWTFKLIICSIFVISFAYAYIPEGASCRTSKQEQGLCTNIQNCEFMMYLLKTQRKNAEAMAYVRSATCSFNGAVPIVCCPRKVTTTTVRTTTVTATTITSSTVTNQSSRLNTNQIDKEPAMKPTAEKEDKNGSLAELLRKPYCGLSNVMNGRIVGGTPAVLDQFPFIVALGYRNRRNPMVPKWLCGGTLITDRHVLTAAHCVYNRTDLYLVRLGELDLYSNDEGAEPEDIKVTSVKIHEKYSQDQRINDIAILTLERKYTSSRVWPICLPHEEPMRSNSYLGSLPIVAGWGALYFDGPRSSTLQLTQVPVVNRNHCVRTFGTISTINNNIICAGYVDNTTKDTCNGDSGGPLMHVVSEGKVLRYYQIGVVSYGFRCAETGYPGVYTRVTSFIDWIRRNIG